MVGCRYLDDCDEGLLSAECRVLRVKCEEGWLGGGPERLLLIKNAGLPEEEVIVSDCYYRLLALE